MIVSHDTITGYYQRDQAVQKANAETGPTGFDNAIERLPVELRESKPKSKTPVATISPMP
ncbi:MAG: hypothetical protein NT069_12825 [Planctomycetota bacterium]|nr:hypothetical protein [Planctomycetota bacterium]